MNELKVVGVGELRTALTSAGDVVGSIAFQNDVNAAMALFERLTPEIPSPILARIEAADGMLSARLVRADHKPRFNQARSVLRRLVVGEERPMASTA